MTVYLFLDRFKLVTVALLRMNHVCNSSKVEICSVIIWNSHFRRNDENNIYAFYRGLNHDAHLTYNFDVNEFCHVVLLQFWILAISNVKQFNFILCRIALLYSNLLNNNISWLILLNWLHVVSLFNENHMLFNEIIKQFRIYKNYEILLLSILNI